MRNVFSLLFLGLSVFFAVTQAIEIQRIRRTLVVAFLMLHQRQNTAAGNSVTLFLNNSWGGVRMDIAFNGQLSSALS
ncbi:uncharacterized protein RAG0_10244 [Rhynchosporium agropyri]|uniref:Uncharacterized protein n=1 Tax=Rhynchosporium agropyri TaxID=914238 RepID=A0A1E1KZ45_9HELO|nr:uncharacterized protein RAG0_10244 [Rhynchosporium agropyri]